MGFFYALHEATEPAKIAYVSGECSTKKEALEQAAMGCCSGEPGDPIFRAKKAIEVSPGCYTIKAKGRNFTSTVLIQVAEVKDFKPENHPLHDIDPYDNDD